MIIQEFAAYPSSPTVVPICSQVMLLGATPISSARFSQQTNFIAFNLPGTTLNNTPIFGGTYLPFSRTGVVVFYSIGVPVILPGTQGIVNGNATDIGNGVALVGAGQIVLPVGAGSFISLIATGVTPYASAETNTFTFKPNGAY